MTRKQWNIKYFKALAKYFRERGNEKAAKICEDAVKELKGK